MKDKVVFLAVYILAFGPCALADTWAHPTITEYYSENKTYIAYVTPASATPATVEVFKTERGIRKSLWKCNLGNTGAPCQCLITDDGQYVTTLDENNRRQYGGWGDYVVAFYSSSGNIAHYSLEQIFGYPERIDDEQFRSLYDRSVSGRMWVVGQVFIDYVDSKTCFCVWLYKGQKWLAWDVTTGQAMDVGDELQKRWDEKGRQWARTEGINSKHYWSAAEFLARFKMPEDRALIEKLLDDKDFYTGDQATGTFKNRQFARFYAASPRRQAAERLLAQWDALPTAERPSETKYRFLGEVVGTLRLPKAPQAGDGRLCIYLVDEDRTVENWGKETPVHRLTKLFEKYSFATSSWPGAQMDFAIKGVTPGRYWVKAVWDKAEPFTFTDKDISGPPQKGDYETTDDQIIEVKAGETITGLIIDCTHQVSEEND